MQQMISAFFHFQHTLNRLFNNCIKLYWYSSSYSWNMKGRGGYIPPEKTSLKKPSLFRVNDTVDLHMSGLGILAPGGSWCVFYATRCQIYWGLTHMWFFAGTLIWYHTNTKSKTHTQTHTAHSGAIRLTHPYKYTFKSLATCSQQLSLLK